MIYTTNAIESLNSVIRHAIKKRKVFPTDDSVKKVVWLAIQSASQKWTMPLKDWRMAMSRFIIEFGDRRTVTSEKRHLHRILNRLGHHARFTNLRELLSNEH